MNRPEGISPDAWEKADAVLLESPAFMIPTATYQATQVLIAKAIQSSVEAERERIAKEVARVVDTLPTEGTVAQTLRTATAIDRIFAAIRSRKGA